MAAFPEVTSFRLAASLLALAAAPLFFAGSTARAERPDRARGTDRLLGVAPRAAKELALERLIAVRDEIDAGASDAGDVEAALHELDHAIEDLEESLDPEFWLVDDQGNIDGSHLDPEDGHHVFNEERHAAENTFDAIRQGEIEDAEVVEELVAIVDSLVSVDRQLAEVAIEDAEVAGGDPEEIDEALDFLARGDELVEEARAETDMRAQADKLYEAMHGSYRHAWKAAIDAVEG